MRRVGIVGYGAIGQYLTRQILENPRCKERLQLAFVWNRTGSIVESDTTVPPHCKLARLEDFHSKGADLIVEVAHPDISKKYGGDFLRAADYLPSSTTAFADKELETMLLSEAHNPTGHGLYIPRGALWGAEDIQRMADNGSLKALTVTMKKAPHHLKLCEPLLTRLNSSIAQGNAAGETVLFEGSVRELCPLAPNNVNTMAAAALAAHTLGLDGTIGRLVADPSLQKHVVEVEAVGPQKPGGEPFRVVSTRLNPAEQGAVTGDATYASFLNSLLQAGGRGDGVHFC
eukprot:gnl/TRDRNA2_/TRDRNA2_35347_c0_seq1.p1 gnl/TRDRNA2_/TRDRNA2_35347_c0~~gnl/TRDRNA2_/TRDRNA2_35347_c0_seq1.p1  ORF type:complete len:287 (-),score=50.87 gnl/TRDRNA2_/TRDRNA2_35347_c0_seq1:67-927(-)